MNKENWIVHPSNNSAKTMIDALYEEAKHRQDPELLSKLGEIQGLYTGYELTNHPHLAEDIMVKLGAIISSLLTKVTFDPQTVYFEKNQSDLKFFMQEQRNSFHKIDFRVKSINEFIAMFDSYLELQGKKEQTRKIYRGKAKAIFTMNEIVLPISLHELFEIFHATLRQCRSLEKKDHNLTSTLNNLINFVDDLLYF